MDGQQLIDEASLMEDAVRAVLDPREVVRAAGGVVYRLLDAGEMEIALIHRPAYDDWSLPKGKLKGDERLESAALREVEEETGFACLVALSLGSIEYNDRRGRDKVVWYWLMRPIGGKFAATQEVDKMKWLPFAAAIDELSYEHDRELLRRASMFHGFGSSDPAR
jgi:8-oxo-dGTP diphosphatase